jgi:hypothetical protein
MSFLSESSKDSPLQALDALDDKLSHTEADGRSGPVAGWFVQKSSPLRNYNEGKAILLHLITSDALS